MGALEFAGEEFQADVGGLEREASKAMPGQQLAHVAVARAVPVRIGPGAGV
ncbi:hypothetical protein ACWFPY_24815 [Nocardia fluminea]